MMRPKRVGAWHRIVSDPEHWEHQPTGTALSWLGDGWVVRFPSTKAVAFTVEDAEHMAAIIRTGSRVDNDEIRRLAGAPVSE